MLNGNFITAVNMDGGGDLRFGSMFYCTIIVVLFLLKEIIFFKLKYVKKNDYNKDTDLFYC